MSYKKICKKCSKAFEASRKDAKFCSNSCRNANSRNIQKEKQKEIDAIKEQQAEKSKRDNDIKSQIQKLENEQNEHLAKIKNNETANSLSRFNIGLHKSNIITLSTDIGKYRFLYKNDIDLYNLYLNLEYTNAIAKKSSYPEVYKLTKNKYEWKYGRDKTKIDNAIQEFRTTKENERKELRFKKSNLEKKITATEKLIEQREDEIKRYNILIVQNQKRLINLDNLRFLPIQEEVTTTAQMNGVTKKKSSKSNNLDLTKPITGADLMNIDFDQFTLPSELGKFLGELERYRLAIALTGDSGAGKTTFSFQLAKLFLDNDFSVKFFSLEMGICGRVKKMVNDCGCIKMNIEGKGKIADVRRAANEFDVVIVDSYGKLGAKPDDFDKLRNAYPNTIFLLIFQKTNNGTIRGGASIKFDSAITIDVQLNEDKEREALMEKSRYGTQGWVYSIAEERVTKK
jgi:KaiC/GvpD/RAD55 family RecA-like ATPase